MKRFASKILLALLVSFFVSSASAVIGYYNIPIYSGDNLVANQLEGVPNNTLNTLFNVSASPSVPNGTTFSKWDSIANAFLPVSTYDSSSQLWDINYSLNLGQGGILHSPSQWTNTFVGGIHIYTNIIGFDFGAGDAWHPNYARRGSHLISCPDPVGGPVSFMFDKVVGRLPEDGEWVNLLDPATQTYYMTTFHIGSGWDNGDPTLSVGKSAWFNLGPVDVVPEPGSLALAGLGAGALLIFRRRKSA